MGKQRVVSPKGWIRHWCWNQSLKEGRQQVQLLVVAHQMESRQDHSRRMAKGKERALLEYQVR